MCFIYKWAPGSGMKIPGSCEWPSCSLVLWKSPACPCSQVLQAGAQGGLPAGATPTSVVPSPSSTLSLVSVRKYGFDCTPREYVQCLLHFPAPACSPGPATESFPIILSLREPSSLAAHTAPRLASPPLSPPCPSKPSSRAAFFKAFLGSSLTPPLLCVIMKGREHQQDTKWFTHSVVIYKGLITLKTKASALSPFSNKAAILPK